MYKYKRFCSWISGLILTVWLCNHFRFYSDSSNLFILVSQIPGQILPGALVFLSFAKVFVFFVVVVFFILTDWKVFSVAGYHQVNSVTKSDLISSKFLQPAVVLWKIPAWPLYKPCPFTLWAVVKLEKVQHNTATTSTY